MRVFSASVVLLLSLSLVCLQSVLSGEGSAPTTEPRQADMAGGTPAVRGISAEKTINIPGQDKKVLPPPVEEDGAHGPQLPPVTVTATRMSTPVDETGVSITVLDGAEDRELHQNHDISESIRQVPGIRVNKGGLTGDFTTVMTRGGNSNQTLLLNDGFKVNRQGGNFDYGHLDPLNADRIEIARGPASSLFGTDAVTGTINVISAKGAGRPELVISAAGGTYGTDRETLSVQGNEKKFSYNVSSARVHRTEATFNNSELEQYSYAGRFDFDFNADHALKVILRGSDFHKGFFEDSGSGYGPSVEPADPNDQIKSRDLLTGLEYRGQILPIWNTTLRMGHYLFDTKMISDPLNPVSVVAGFAQSVGRTFSQERRPSLDWQNDITAYSSQDGKFRDIITVGTSVEQERYNQDDTQFGNNANVERTNVSGYFQNRLELFDRAYITTGVRREHNGQFGDFTTGRADVSISIPESSTRIHGAVGNAFRAPSFFELFSAIGNPNLEPEKNFAYEAGLDQHFWDKRASLSATWFNNDFRDMINFNPATSLFDNLNTANTRGFEFSAEVTPIKKITLRSTATLMHTEDDQGRRLLRRPGNTYTAQIVAHPVKGLDLALDLLRVGARGDFGPTTANPFARVHAESYTRVDAAASYRFFTHWRAFVRVENIFNRSYEDVVTFPSAGITTLAGMEFTWK